MQFCCLVYATLQRPCHVDFKGLLYLLIVSADLLPNIFRLKLTAMAVFSLQILHEESAQAILSLKDPDGNRDITRCISGTRPCQANSVKGTGIKLPAESIVYTPSDLKFSLLAAETTRFIAVSQSTLLFLELHCCSLIFFLHAEPCALPLCCPPRLLVAYRTAPRS